MNILTAPDQSTHLLHQQSQLLDHILRFLTLKDRITFINVSTTWKHILFQEHFWNSIRFDQLPSFSVDDRMIERLCQVAPTQFISEVSFKSCNRVTDSGFSLLFHTLHNVSKLTLRGCVHRLTNQTLESLSQSPMSQSLEFLDVGACIKTTSESLITTLTACSQIKALNVQDLQYVNDDVVTRIITECPQIEELYMSGTSVSDTTIEVIMSKLANQIRVLDISYTGSITDVGIQLLRESTTLRKLKCYGVREFRDTTLIALKDIDLEELDLGLCSGITDGGITAFFAEQRRLRYCNLYRCYELTDVSIRAIADSCGNNLERIGIFGLDRISPEVVAYLQSSCPLLVNIS